MAVKALETGHRPAGAELPRGRSRARGAQPVEGRRLPGPVRAAPRGRLRLADQHDAAALDAGRRRPPPRPERARLRLPGRRPGAHGGAGCAGSAARTTRELEVVQRRLRVVDRGPSAAPAAEPEPAAVPGPCRSPRRTVDAAVQAPAPSRRPCRAAGAALRPRAGRPSRAAGARPRIRSRRGARARRREDRLPGRHARPRPRPGGRPRHRHGQAGRGLRAIRETYGIPATTTQAARLPDARPRRRLRPRARAGTGRRRSPPRR